MPSDAELQRLLDCGALETVGIRLVSASLGWMTSRSAQGICISTVSEASAGDVTFETNSPGLGLVAAAATLVARRLEQSVGKPEQTRALQ